MINKELEHSLNEAFRTACDKHHEFITVEHLLLAILDNQVTVDILRACLVDIARLRHDLIKYIEETTPLIPVGVIRESQPTLGFQRVLQRAAFHVQSSGKREVTGANLLVALFR